LSRTGIGVSIAGKRMAGSEADKMRSHITLRIAVLTVLAAALLVSPLARAQEKITLGAVGQASANLWPVFIGIDKGFFAAEGLTADIVYIQSNAAMVQQVTAGSLAICMSTGLVDPIRAVSMGASIAVLRVEVQAPPFDLMAKPTVKGLKDLKGKVISVGGPKDITRIYVERMLEPHGVKRGDFDMLFAGATTARTSALLAGAVDAAIVLPPYNFQLEAKGFHSLGLASEYVKDLPMSGTVVNVAWASKNKATLDRLLRAEARSIAWFEDVKNRAEAVKILMAASGLRQEDVEKSYDFFRDGHYFEPTGKVSKAKLISLAKAMESLGDLPGALDVNKVALPGITQMVD
jgi:ABC-type nitrate/sulfonate/bicarbonate transport system substrate-binding protein